MSPADTRASVPLGGQDRVHLGMHCARELDQLANTRFKDRVSDIFHLVIRDEAPSDEVSSNLFRDLLLLRVVVTLLFPAIAAMIGSGRLGIQASSETRHVVPTD